MKFVFSILFISICFISLGQSKIKPILNEDLNFKSQVYYKSNEATLYFSVGEHQLLRKKNVQSDEFEQHFSIQVTFNNSKKNILTKEYTVKASENSMNKIIDSFVIGVQPGNFNYELTLTDLNKNEFNYFEFNVDPNKSFGKCYFLKRKLNGLPILSNHFSDNEIQISSHKYRNQSIQCFLFKNDKLAPPPFVNLSGSVNLGSADSLFQLSFSPNATITGKELTGLIVFSSKNLDLNNFHFAHKVPDIFPYFSNYEELIAPLRFISSRDEFTMLKNSTNKKMAFEKFWINLGGDKETAKELIRHYYARVKFANKHFSSFKEGWKTDRGILYIVFGEPELMDNRGKEIRWTYSSKFESRSSVFTFYQSLSNISNDFELVRNPLFKSGWYVAIETWRNGQVYQR